MNTVKSNRDTSIDFLRGLAVILMIFIHVAAYFGGDSSLKTAWNYAQAAVPFFVFCAGYVYFSRTQDHVITISYLWKRISRLIIPYYIFLFVYVVVFSLLGEPFGTGFWMKNLLLTGGLDLNWLVVLFIQLTVLMPVLGWLYAKHKRIFITVVSGIFGLTVLLLFEKMPYDKRQVVWLTWPVMTIYSLLLAKHEKSWRFITGSIVLGVALYLTSIYILQAQGKSLTFFDNKYPPNLLYMSYGIWTTGLVYLIHSKLQIGKTPIQKVFDYFSVHSYSLFFSHFLLVFVLVHTELIYAWGFTISLIVIFGVSLVVQQILNFFFNLKKKRS